MKTAVLLSLFILSATAHADFVPVCERTPEVKANLETLTSKTCAQITETELAPITRVAVPNQHIAAFKEGDFSGLPNLEILNIKGNLFTTLPAGLTAELPKLKTLVIFETKMTAVPDDFLAANPLIENLYMFGNPFTALPEAVWQRFADYQHWTGVELDQKFDDANAGRLMKIFSGRTGVDFFLH